MTESTAGNVRRLLVLDAGARQASLRTLRPRDLPVVGGEDTLLLWGEALCQALLQEEPAGLVIARGPLAFLPGNKATVGYISPLTGLPHYSFVGGRAFAELLNLGLDAIVLVNPTSSDPLPYVTVSGRAPDLDIVWRSSDELPEGQRSAYYHLLDQDPAGTAGGSIFTTGSGALRGYRTANLAVEGLYHAGRGGAGAVFARFLRALVLRGTPMDLESWMGDAVPGADAAEAFLDFREREITPRIANYCDRLARRDGGTVTKLYTTGSGDHPTLPARNAGRVGYDLADLGARRVLGKSRVGQTGCQWCHVNCRHWHWVDVDYAPGGRDRYLDDFEPTYALFAMLDLQPREDTLRGRLALIDEVDRRVVVPIEQLGIDIIDAGVAIAALFEGLERGLIPPADVPEGLRSGPYFGSVDRAAEAIASLSAPDPSRALRALGDGPQALAECYPQLRDLVFTSGAGTLANPGHGNALWTFLMPFSRYFGHYSGQIYKVEGVLTPDMDADEIDALFYRVVRTMLQREFIICIGNSLSTCAFTFPIFTEGGRGEGLDSRRLLVRTLAQYGFGVHEHELKWFAQAFWAQSIALKLRYGWVPPRAADLPGRVFELLSKVLDHPSDDVAELMDRLIDVWLRQAGEVMRRFGHEVPW
jgi:aldehyde:ferredoxin oxidoreductase